VDETSKTASANDIMTCRPVAGQRQRNRKRPVNSNRGTAFSVRSVPSYMQDSESLSWLVS
jgi:hypothetical protein